MLDEELRRLTASEPYLFQTSEKWLLDEDKLTFIVLSNADVLDPSNEETIAPWVSRITQIADVALLRKHCSSC